MEVVLSLSPPSPLPLPNQTATPQGPLRMRRVGGPPPSPPPTKQQLLEAPPPLHLLFPSSLPKPPPAHSFCGPAAPMAKGPGGGRGGGVSQQGLQGVRPYLCGFPGCGHRATTRSHLVEHLRSHTGERPYTCEVPGCGYSATASGTLKRHVRAQTGERPYPCDFL